MSAKLSADPDNFPALTLSIWALEDLQKGKSSNQLGEEERKEEREREEGKKRKKKKKIKAVSDSRGFKISQKQKVSP